MHNHFTNLVPEDRRLLMKRNYYMRLMVVAVLFVTALVTAAILLLIPTYVLLTASIETKLNHLATIESSPTSATEKSFTARLMALSSSTQAIANLSKTPSVSALIRSALTVPRPGIMISNVVYTPKTDKVMPALLVSGRAATREALRNYQLALQGAPFAKSTDLPVSAYAQQSDIPFTITVILSL